VNYYLYCNWTILVQVLVEDLVTFLRHSVVHGSHHTGYWVQLLAMMMMHDVIFLQSRSTN